MAGLKVILRKTLEDERGSFARLFCARELEDLGSLDPQNGRQKNPVQINHSITRQKGAVRGMHYQLPPHAETKIVQCLRGRAFDVAVDLRAGSPTFLVWHGVELSPGNQHALCIPEGFAHGFQALEEDTELLYLHTEYYAPASESAIHVADPRLNIAWPLAIPKNGISDRDRSHAFLTPGFAGITL